MPGLSLLLRPLLLLTALTLSILAVSCSPPGSSGSRLHSAATLRVMTYNIHHGAGPDDELDLEHIAEVIRREQPDVVALQEVDRGVERSERRDLLLELAELTGLDHAAFGKNLDHQGGHYGNGVLSRYPITRQENLWLEQTAPGEQRGVLQVLLDVHGQEVAVLVTHLDHRSPGERLFSVQQIEEKLLPAYRQYPVLLTGDFNEVPEGAVYRRLTSHLADAWAVGEGPGYTIPVDSPSRRIDYLFHGPQFTPVSAHVPRSDASDHLPLVVELRLTD